MRTTDRLIGFSGLIALGLSSGPAFTQQQADTCDCMPVSGQPAADVLASHDRWGNPTFIGGITNGGPDAGSVW
ncbi:hypothetical protein [Candidatus Rariloculus sp.]|uniref:hypothetical protein n=1 Tax=Candidatus Rariloculus sp. TaxID=3101265 RepID=UPI003D0B5207